MNRIEYVNKSLNDLWSAQENIDSTMYMNLDDEDSIYQAKELLEAWDLIQKAVLHLSIVKFDLFKSKKPG